MLPEILKYLYITMIHEISKVNQIFFAQHKFAPRNALRARQTSSDWFAGPGALTTTAHKDDFQRQKFIADLGMIESPAPALPACVHASLEANN